MPTSSYPPRKQPTYQEMLGNYITSMGEANTEIGRRFATFAKDVVTGKKAIEGLQEFQDVSLRAIQGDPEAAADLGMRFLGVTAFHGSPHKFTKFKMSKIGTGEGAQAYGHGLYFAENPGTAEWYAQKLAQPPANIANRAGRNPAFKDIVFDYSGDLPDSVRAAFSRHASNVLRDNPAASVDEILNVMRIYNPVQAGKIDKSLVSNIRQKYSGNLYKVDISDDAVKNFLDWDKPLSQQPGSVKKLVPELFEMHKKIAGGMKPGDAARSLGLNPAYGHMDQGALVYEVLQDKYGADKASQLLKKAGIPGIRYLDQGSRQAGKGTYNYVVFDEDIVKILGRE